MKKRKALEQNIGIVKKKIIPLLLAFISLSLSLAITLGSCFINEVGFPFPWLTYQWRDPSYVELINYRGLWADFFFWLAVILGLLVLIKRIKNYSFSFKKVVFFVSILVILVFDWAALHDIAKGEPNPYQEYVFLIFTPFLFLVMFFIYKRKLLE